MHVSQELFYKFSASTYTKTINNSYCFDAPATDACQHHPPDHHRWCAVREGPTPQGASTRARQASFCVCVFWTAVAMFRTCCHPPSSGFIYAASICYRIDNTIGIWHDKMWSVFPLHFEGKGHTAPVFAINNTSPVATKWLSAASSSHVTSDVTSVIWPPCTIPPWETTATSRCDYAKADIER